SDSLSSNRYGPTPALGRVAIVGHTPPQHTTRWRPEANFRVVTASPSGESASNHDDVASLSRVPRPGRVNRPARTHAPYARGNLTSLPYAAGNSQLGFRWAEPQRNCRPPWRVAPSYPNPRSPGELRRRTRTPALQGSYAVADVRILLPGQFPAGEALWTGLYSRRGPGTGCLPGYDRPGHGHD